MKKFFLSILIVAFAACHCVAKDFEKQKEAASKECVQVKREAMAIKGVEPIKALAIDRARTDCAEEVRKDGWREFVDNYDPDALVGED